MIDLTREVFLLVTTPACNERTSSPSYLQLRSNMYHNDLVDFSLQIVHCARACSSPAHESNMRVKVPRQSTLQSTSASIVAPANRQSSVAKALAEIFGQAEVVKNTAAPEEALTDERGRLKKK